MRPPTWSLPALAALLSIAIGACGGTHASSGATRSRGPISSTASGEVSAAAVGYRVDDGDRDSDDESRGPAREDDDRKFLAEYGPDAKPAERQLVAPLVKRYFERSAAGDGRSVCALLTTALATSLAPGGDHTRGAGICAAAVAPILSERHRQLVAEDPATMTVSGLRVKGDFALAILSFQTSPRSTVLLQRDGRRWRLAALLDSQLP